MHVPGIIEIVESNRLIAQWEACNKGVPDGWYVCPYCLCGFSYDPISVSAAPDAPVCCYECLDAETKTAYDNVFGRRIP